MPIPLGFFATISGSSIVGGWISILNAGTPKASGARITKDSSNNLYVTGTYQTSTSGDVFLAKYNSDGILQWQKSLGGSSQNEYGSDIEVDSSGNIYIGGSCDVSGYPAFLVLKYNSSGTLTWSKQLNGSYDDYMSSIALSPDGSQIWLTGASPNNGSSTWYQNWAYYDSSGNLQLQKYLGVPAPGGWGYDVALDSVPYAIVVGYGIYSGGIPRFTVIRTDGSTTTYKRMLQSSGDALAFGVAVDSSNNAYVVGQSGTYSTPDAQIVKYNSSGTIQWQRTLSSSGSENFNKVYVDTTAGYVYANGYNNTLGQIIAKYDLSGNLQWQRSLNVAGISINNIVTNGSDYMYMSGSINDRQIVLKLPTSGAGTGNIVIDGYTVVYSASNLTDAASSYSDTDQGTGIGSTSLSSSNGPTSVATPTLTQTKTDF